MNRTAHNLATLALVSGLAGSAQAADLGLYPHNLTLQYRVNDELAPVMKVNPNTTGASPFNSANTPYLLPCDVQNFGGQWQVFSAAPGSALYPQVVTRLYRADDSLITSHGYSNTTNFNLLYVDMPLLQAGTSALAGFTLVSTVSPFRDWLYQPGDLPANTPVRLEMTVRAFSDSQYTQPVADSNAANDVMNLWLMRVCGS
jgi:hypothetical protein